jgi:hypothetical protein
VDEVKVVAHFAGGRVLKGKTADFFPNKTRFHLDTGSGEKALEIQLQDLKAVFWVKDFAGDSAHVDPHEFAPGQAVSGRKAEVTFKDGEVLIGATLGYDPSRPGFFLTGVDPGGNNQRIYVVTAAVKSFRFV